MSMFGPAALIVAQDDAESDISSDTDSDAESSRTPHRVSRLKDTFWEAGSSALAILQSRLRRVTTSTPAEARRKPNRGVSATPWQTLLHALQDLQHVYPNSGDSRSIALFRFLQWSLVQLFGDGNIDKDYRSSLDRLEARALTQCHGLYRSSGTLGGEVGDAGFDEHPSAILDGDFCELYLRLLHCATSASTSVLDLSSLSIPHESWDHLPVLDLLKRFGVDRTEIIRLYLNDNNLDQLPDWVTGLIKLHTLSLNGNPFLASLPLSLVKIRLTRLHIHRTVLPSSADSDGPMIYHPSSPRLPTTRPPPPKLVRRRSVHREKPPLESRIGVASLVNLVIFRLFQLDQISPALPHLPPHLQKLALDIVKCDICRATGYLIDVHELASRFIGGLIKPIKGRWCVVEMTTGNRKYSAREPKGTKEVAVEGLICAKCRRWYVEDNDEENNTIETTTSSSTMRFHP